MNSCAGFCLGTSDTQKSITLTIKRKQKVRQTASSQLFLKPQELGLQGRQPTWNPRQERDSTGLALWEVTEKNPRAQELALWKEAKWIKRHPDYTRKTERRHKPQHPEAKRGVIADLRHVQPIINIVGNPYPEIWIELSPWEIQTTTKTLKKK